jgi:hypothetical protein
MKDPTKPILLVDNQNAIKPMSIIPVIGFVGSFIAFIPIVGMFVHERSHKTNYWNN